MTLRGLFPVLDGLIDDVSLALAERRFAEFCATESDRPKAEEIAIRLIVDVLSEMYIRRETVG